ncbi:MAG TPA: response regulator transcription factor [Gammaproteobacteria bacterium]|nr:response regulator transcription factor [Gammaproteobacteria bacterium]
MMPRVLLADDHPMFREGLRMLLEREDFEIVAECADGNGAVASARALRPDAAVLDIAMAGLNGLDAARQIRDEATSRVILLSAYEDAAYLRAAREAGVFGYVLKAQAGSELTEVLHRALRMPLGGSRAATRAGSRLIGPDAMQECARPLTQRESQILCLIANGNTTRETATILGISVKTADSHRSHLMQKLDIHETAGLVRYAVREGMIRA